MAICWYDGMPVRPIVYGSVAILQAAHVLPTYHYDEPVIDNHEGEQGHCERGRKEEIRRGRNTWGKEQKKRGSRQEKEGGIEYTRYGVTVRRETSTLCCIMYHSSSGCCQSY